MKYQLFFRRKPSDVPKVMNTVILIVFTLLIIFFISLTQIKAQSRLILNGSTGNAYVVLNNIASPTTSVYLVIDNSNPNAITRLTGTGNSHIIAESEYNRVKWNIGTAMTDSAAYWFQLGTGTTNWIPFRFKKDNAGVGAGTVSVSSWYTASNSTLPTGGVTMCYSGGTDENLAIDRFWVINVDGYTTKPQTDVRFYYNPAELDGIGEGELVAQRWGNATPCAWESPLGSVDQTNNFVGVDNISDFSPWTLSRSSTPLPVELLYFSAQWKDKEQISALLHWETASEINNDYFFIERGSKNEGELTTEMRWEEIGKVNGAGNSSTIIGYDFVDADLPTTSYQLPIHYYRLKQVDYDGSFTYSDIQSLSKKNNSVGDIISIFPNPSKEFIDYLIFCSEDTSVDILAIDVTGKVVVSQKEEIKKGINTRRISTSFLSSGNYILQITTGNGTKTKKQFVIQ